MTLPSRDCRVDANPVPAGRELALVVLGLGAAALLLTYPLILHPGTTGRVDNGDARFLIWNVAWVARTLVVDPLHILDANIFYPHRAALVFSEANLGAGILAMPVYWATRNPYAAYNAVTIASFVLSGTATYYLVRRLVGDRRAAAVAAVCFAFCPARVRAAATHLSADDAVSSRRRTTDRIGYCSNGSSIGCS